MCRQLILVEALDLAVQGDVRLGLIAPRAAICAALELTLDDYLLVRDRLIDLDLIAFDGTRFQVLSLPPAPSPLPSRPLVTRDDFEDHDSATIRRLIQSSLDRRR